VGLDIHATRLVLLAKREGVDFTRAATLGHQWLRVEPSSLRSIFAEMRVPMAPNLWSEIEASAPFTDGLLRTLGAQTVESIDASGYEGASIIHDMNTELPPALQGRFTLLIDCGTLEHIFNFPVAIRNCMRLLQPGGHLLLATPANNFMGHGFYQFSPELFYRVLSAENGFRIRHMYVCELRHAGSWYELTDPATLGSRVELINSVPTYLLILATKVGETGELLATAPQQSDYERGKWLDSPGGAEPGSGQRLRSLGRELAPGWLKDLKAGLLRRLRSPFGAPCFKRVNQRSVRDLVGN
jgi:SAM-dependent methyltransferase